MTTDNTPIAAWAPSTALHKLASRRNNAPCVLTDTPAEFNDVALVRLSDYEAMKAAYEEELFQVRQDRDAHFGELIRALEQVDAMKAECERLVEALSIARDYVFSSLEEKKLALAGYPQMWRCEQDDLAMIDATLSAYRKETSHDK